MPIRKMGVQSALATAKAGLVGKLAEELKENREFGQPTVYEQEYSTKKARVTVIWDAWAEESLEDRSAVILKAYEIAQGQAGRERIALASGLTVPEAAAAGLLPFQVIPALRKSDAVKPEEIDAAMLEQGASRLSPPDGLQLRFATKEEAEACVQRLARKLPASEQIWIISREIHARDTANFGDSASGDSD
jgi:hypothetical protein